MAKTCMLWTYGGTQGHTDRWAEICSFTIIIVDSQCSVKYQFHSLFLIHCHSFDMTIPANSHHYTPLSRSNVQACLQASILLFISRWERPSTCFPEGTSRFPRVEILVDGVWMCHGRRPLPSAHSDGLKYMDPTSRGVGVAS